MFVYNLHAYEALVDLHKNLAEAKRHTWLYLSLVDTFPPLLSHILSLVSDAVSCSLFPRLRALPSFIPTDPHQSPDPLTRIPGAAVMKIPHARLESSPPAGQLFCWPFIISRSASRKSLGMISRHRKSSEVWKARPAAVGISTGRSAHSSSNPWFALS